MYSIDVDTTNRIINIVLAGSVSIQEIEAYAKEIYDLFYNAKEKEYSILASLGRLDPVSQDCIPHLTEAMKIALMRANKIATVHKRVVTQMQMHKIERDAKSDILNTDNKVMRFSSMREAINYLKL
jgi:hypothetical protein